MKLILRLLLLPILVFSTLSDVRAQYCASNATSTADSKLELLVLAGNTLTINNPSLGICNGYTNYTAIPPADLTQGNNYTVSITHGTCGGNYTRWSNAWIDWNNDNDFADAGEMLSAGTTTSSAAGFVNNINFSVPGAATLGNHRMRAIVKEGGNADDPCAVYTWGETEDYTITVVAGTPMTITSASVSQLASGNIINCSLNQGILRLQINTTGTVPLTLTQIQTNLTGTAATSAFSSSKIYYTGTSSSFSTSTLFGSAAVSTSTYSINGSQNLVSGANYFWLVYDLNNTGAIGATVDAIISQFTASAVNYNAGSTPALSPTNPAGNGVITVCISPGGISNGLQTWLRADMGTSGVASVTNWQNQANGGTATNLLGGPPLQIANSSYNYNRYIDFQGPAATQDGGVNPSRQCILLNGYNDVNGIDYKSLFFTFQLNDLSRTQTHCATVQGVTMGSPANGTWHGDINGAQASILLESYDITDFGTSSPAGTWQRNGVNILSNSLHTSQKHILSSICQTGGSTTLNSFLGGQNDQVPASSFSGHARDWKGPAAEIIGFTTGLTATERQKVHSYLAIKYGVTLTSNYLSTNGGTIFTTAAPYNNNIIGIGRDDNEALYQKQSHYDSDMVRLYISTLQPMNESNTGVFSNDISYVVIGDNNGAHCTTAAALAEMPSGLTNCALYSRLEKEWKVTRTNHAGNFNMDILLSPCGAPGSVTTSDLRLLIDDDGNFSNGGTQCYYNGDGSGLVLSYANPYITVSNISAAMIPDNNIKYITIASINVATPLPVELVQFDAQLNASKRSVDLTWSTETEHNSDYFEVQKLVTNQWAVLDVLAAKGESDIIQNYYTVDFNPAFGVNYYRLKQVDKNGTFVYSDIRAVALNPGSELIIYPNPAQFSVQLIQKNISREKITLIDQAGRTINVPSLVLSDDLIQINTQDIANGIYLIRIGAEAVVQKLAVQH